MQKLIYVLVSLVFLISCKPEKYNAHKSDSGNNFLIDAEDTFSEISKFDLIFDPNAPKRITRNIKLDKQGNLLIAAYDDIIRYNGNLFSKLSKPKGLESWYAFDVLEDSKENIWIASDQLGVFFIDAKTDSVTNFTTKDGLGHLRNMCVYEDKDGNIWIGGQGGLSKYDGKKFTNFTIEDGLPHNDINTIIEDYMGNIWFGTRGNAGLYDGNTFTEIKNNEGKPFFNVWSIMEDESNNIWLIDSSGLWKYSNNTFNYRIPDVWKIYEDNKGAFWYTGMLYGGGSTLARTAMNLKNNNQLITTQVFKSEKMLFGIVEDTNGNIWIGGGDGIWKYNDGIVKYYTGISK